MASVRVGASCGTLGSGTVGYQPAGRALAAQIVETVLTWVERVRQRRQLGQLSDHMLRDIGLSRADVESEVAKRFWQT